MKDIIRKIVKKYGTNDPFELADCLGAITITAPLKDGTRGFYDYYKRNGIICIDENLSDEEARDVYKRQLKDIETRKRVIINFCHSGPHSFNLSYNNHTHSRQP